MNERQKQLKAQYKERKQVGGIYRILNKENGKFYLNRTPDMQGIYNRYISSQATGLCTHPCLVKDWKEYGKDAFVFEVLEEWEKKAEQTDAEYVRDLKALLELWSEKLPQDRY